MTSGVQLDRKPLNGTKTHPLSAYSLGVLRAIEHKPVPAQEINAGVIDRLWREDLIHQVQLPSPYKTHKGSHITHYKITDAGRARLRMSK